MIDLMAFLAGGVGGVLVLGIERVVTRWRAKRAVKNQPKASSHEQLMALIREAKRQGLSLPPEAKELLQEDPAKQTNGGWR